MYKELYVFRNGIPIKAVIRNYSPDDFEALIQVQQDSFPPPFPQDLLWNPEQLGNHTERFPEGAICAEADGRIVGSMTALRLPQAMFRQKHSWDEATDSGYIRNHDPTGDTLYVVDVCVTPAYRQTGLGKWLMQTMYEVTVNLGLRRLLGGGRMPGYRAAFLENGMTAQKYLEAIIQGERKDPVLSYLLRCGRMPVEVVENYLEDEDSLNYAVLMEWNNPFWKEND
ncbi:acetyltransferase [Paenibacillus swuensis]|uniref:Acetyltransferase n=1 Tax=Paenibacillus swuensis TaxID=1178515 RepID=A0A172TL90_9BACL|nr:GNAT family N-acetyltransferase [Paenibacillus swuensis]ANE47825.1 acetyltransferase [Paenibacillus swuensis]